MEEGAQVSLYCLACGAENPGRVRMCRDCGRPLKFTPRQRREGAAFVLNELEALRELDAIPDHVYRFLRRRYREALGQAGGEAAPAPTAPGAPATPVAPPAAARKEGPSWLAEQQANLLLYLGAFLIVIAALIYVGYSEQVINDGVKMALLVLLTAAFLAAGLFCSKFPRVWQAGVVFFAVGALMVPINFVGAYGFFFAEDDIDPTGLWLAGSLASGLFYGAVSLLGMGRWYAVPMVVATFSALGAALVLVDGPPEAYPGSYIALALLLTAPSRLPQGRIREAFGPPGLWAAHAVVPVAAVAALWMTVLRGGQYGDEFGDTTRWYLPPTAAIAALFYWTQALWIRGAYPKLGPALTVAALAMSGGAAVTLVYAIEVGEQWYGPAVAIVGWLYAGGSEGFGPRWFGRRYVGWMALGTVTVSWLLFEGLYGDFSRHGAGVHFAAAAFYVVAARTVNVDLPVFTSATATQRWTGEAGVYRVPAAVGLIYAAGLTIGLGYYYLLSSLPAAETAGASDLSWAFFGLSLGIAAVAATMRWWWPEIRAHTYAIALGMSLFVLLSAVQAEGQVALLLAVYTGVALTLTFWEREALALPMPAAYGFFALLAAWRYFEPNDAFLPLVVSAVGYGLYSVYALISGREARWALMVQVLAFAYAAVAPIVGWVRLAILADPEGFVGTERFEETGLYQTAAASVLLLGVLLIIQSWLLRRFEMAAGASAVLMVALLLEVGHFRPENVQAYTAPLGVYLLAAAFLALRMREPSEGLRALVGPLQALGAVVLMGPSLEQAWQDGGWPYALILLGEGLLLLGVALVLRSVWLVAASTGFVVLDALRYLFDASRALPNWAILAIAGTVVMAAGTAILLSRERWTDWQRTVQAWWNRESLP
jgi:hypothetical protein